MHGIWVPIIPEGWAGEGGVADCLSINSLRTDVCVRSVLKQNFFLKLLLLLLKRRRLFPLGCRTRCRRIEGLKTADLHLFPSPQLRILGNEWPQNPASICCCSSSLAFCSFVLSGSFPLRSSAASFLHRPRLTAVSRSLKDSGCTSAS